MAGGNTQLILCSQGQFDLGDVKQLGLSAQCT